jgi:hypothetical protein
MNLGCAICSIALIANVRVPAEWGFSISVRSWKTKKHIISWLREKSVIILLWEG